MRRGEVWTVATGSGYAGKPRPAVIVQDDLFLETESVTVCSFTTMGAEVLPIRLEIEPNSQNGLIRSSYLMVDKISTVRRDKLGERMGSLSDRDMRNSGGSSCGGRERTTDHFFQILQRNAQVLGYTAQCVPRPESINGIFESNGATLKYWLTE